METADQYHEVQALGCEASQGFYFAPPMPADALSTLIIDGPLHLPSRALHLIAMTSTRSMSLLATPTIEGTSLCSTRSVANWGVRPKPPPT